VGPAKLVQRKASMGPRSLSAEGTARATRLSRPGGASMGPRSLSAEGDPARIPSYPEMIASMGPRSLSAEGVPLNFNNLILARLQWGRAL